MKSVLIAAILITSVASGPVLAKDTPPAAKPTPTAAAATAAPPTTAQTPGAQTPGAPTPMQFITQAEEMRFDGKTLRLTDPAGETIIAAEGRETTLGVMNNPAFVAMFAELAPAGGKDAPNAMVVLSGSDEEPAVVELSAPRMDKGDIVFDVKILEGKLPDSHEGVTVMIDPWVWVGPRRVWRDPVVAVPPATLYPRCHWTPYYHGAVCRY
ncbi:hypothetical protein L1787_09975 [Acuticoccus sp. M5D2P5]|uniref:hypothetical protein n=1 Tax=Acuticoccus kalidii TaxID=2910977 RepID=UPI001F2572E7|nr:hypothetical protein [Acuticoccus kalidii]MCF3933741.1 hypothetical protein [Acuticoccus kalidii]